jgi:hypothetical protein
LSEIDGVFCRFIASQEVGKAFAVESGYLFRRFRVGRRLIPGADFLDDVRRHSSPARQFGDAGLVPVHVPQQGFAEAAFHSQVVTVHSVRAQ